MQTVQEIQLWNKVYIFFFKVNYLELVRRGRKNNAAKRSSDHLGDFFSSFLQNWRLPSPFSAIEMQEKEQSSQNEA